MDDILKKAREYRNQIAREERAHALSAEYHRSNDMRLGVIVTCVSTLVTTGIFVSLLEPVKNGNVVLGHPAPGWPMAGFVLAALFSIAAPILTSLHTRLHNAADTASHVASASRYAAVVMQLDIFLLRYSLADPADRKTALDLLNTIMITSSEIRSSSLTMPQKAYDAADRTAKKETLGKTEFVAGIVKLNREIIQMEQRRDSEAKQFFTRLLSDDLIFRRADGTVVGKQGPLGFITALDNHDQFKSRRTSDTEVTLFDRYALITLVVAAVEQDDSVRRYRNIRLFSRLADQWLLEFWYNYEIRSN
jgi:hypothetical protein